MARSSSRRDAVGGQVEQRAGERGDGDAVVAADVGGMQVGDAVRPDPVAAADVAAGDRDVQFAHGRRAQAPEHGGRGVAEQRALAVGQHRGHRVGERRLERADEIDTAMPAPQPALRDPMSDRVPTQSHLGQLRRRHDPVPLTRERHDPPIGRINRHFFRLDTSLEGSPEEMPLLPA